MVLSMMALVVLEIVGRATASSGESDKPLDYYRLYDSEPGIGKRAAYSYVSEYKRLPVYNFGLGKRAPESERLYSFGLGKRSHDTEDEFDSEMKEDYNKRMKQYSFGLGKRAPKQYSFGLGKRPEGKMYSFGLGKRASYEYENHNMDGYEVPEEVKRAAAIDNGRRLYSFGLGKRDYDDEARQGRSMMYNFGLGKRSDATLGEKDSSMSSLLVN